MKNFLVALASIGLVVLFRITGLIDNVWTGIAVLGILATVALLQKLNVTKLNLVTKIFLGWIIVAVVIPAIHNYLSFHPPLTGEAVQRKEVMEDIRGSELIRPPGLRAVEKYKQSIDRADDALGQSAAEEMEGLTTSFENGGITSEEYSRRIAVIQNRIRNMRQWRSEAGKLLTEGYPSPNVASRIQSVWGIPGRIVLWGLGICLVGLIAASVILKKPVIAKAGIGIIVILALLFVLDFFIWRMPATAGKQSSYQPAPVARQPLQVIRVQVEPNRESDWVTLPPGRQGNVKARGRKIFFIFPNGQRVEVQAGEANLGMLPGRRFKLAGDTAGEVVFTIY